LRKLKLQMQISVDGFVSTGPNDEQRWVTWAWEEIGPYVMQLLDSSDTILIGRGLAVDYIPYWEAVYAKPEHPMHRVAAGIVRARKVVFSRALDRSIWANAELAKGDLAEEVRRLKNEEGKEIIVYGGSSFVTALIREKLIDEFHLFVNPVALGSGGSVFGALTDTYPLELKKSIAYDCGIVLMHYETK
jgi:dihydrofolate reductase